MISNAQKSLLKRAQRQAGLSDTDYRDALELIARCRTSTDARFSDRHFDKTLAYFEAIHWRKVDSGELQPVCKSNAVFAQRGYWAKKNTNAETSRDRFALSNITGEIADLEAELLTLGFGANYCASIRANVTEGRADVRAQYLYKAALQRTLNSKHKHAAAVACAA